MRIVLLILLLACAMAEERVYTIAMKVTACSPEDPHDVDFYARNGYEGNIYGIAAHTAWFERGTKMRVPGYRKSTWQTVDSAGGSIIRRSARRGVPQIDVKYRTYYSAKQWGVQWLRVEVILPASATEEDHTRMRRLEAR